MPDTAFASACGAVVVPASLHRLRTENSESCCGDGTNRKRLISSHLRCQVTCCTLDIAIASLALRVHSWDLFQRQRQRRTRKASSCRACITSRRVGSHRRSFAQAHATVAATIVISREACLVSYAEHLPAVTNVGVIPYRSSAERMHSTWQPQRASGVEEHTFATVTSSGVDSWHSTTQAVCQSWMSSGDSRPGSVARPSVSPIPDSTSDRIAASWRRQ